MKIKSILVVLENDHSAQMPLDVFLVKYEAQTLGGENGAGYWSDEYIKECSEWEPGRAPPVRPTGLTK